LGENIAQTKLYIARNNWNASTKYPKYKHMQQAVIVALVLTLASQLSARAPYYQHSTNINSPIIGICAMKSLLTTLASHIKFLKIHMFFLLHVLPTTPIN